MTRYRWIMVLVFSAITSQLAFSGVPCPHKDEDPEVGMGTYYVDVLNAIRPEGQWPLITVSQVGSDKKLILRKGREGQAELILGTPREKVFDSLNKLQQSCELPSDPEITASKLGIDWKIESLPASVFQNLFDGFLAAMSEETKKIRNDERARSLGHSVMLIHTAEFKIVYSGTEQVELLIDDTGDPKTASPMMIWIKKLLQLSESKFHASI
jgi:hypothetical protein